MLAGRSSPGETQRLCHTRRPPGITTLNIKHTYDIEFRRVALSRGSLVLLYIVFFDSTRLSVVVPNFVVPSFEIY